MVRQSVAQMHSAAAVKLQRADVCHDAQVALHVRKGIGKDWVSLADRESGDKSRRLGNMGGKILWGQEVGYLGRGCDPHRAVPGLQKGVGAIERGCDAILLIETQPVWLGRVLQG